ncbi:MAG: hypothetical protein ABIA47_05090 [bacterium]
MKIKLLIRRSFLHCLLAVPCIIFLFTLLPGDCFADYSVLGISPPTIYADDILRDVPYYQEVIIGRSDSTTEMPIEVSVLGEDAEFIIVDDGFVFQVGESQHLYSFSILPKGAPIGEYNAKIEFLPTEIDTGDMKGTAGVILRRGVGLGVYFTVTDRQTIEFEILDFKVLPSEEGLPIMAKYTVENSGNVAWRPDIIDFIVYDAGSGETMLSTSVEGADIDYVTAGATEEITQEIGILEVAGDYILTANFFFNNTLVYSASEAFEVFLSGTLKQFGEFSGFTSNKTEYEVRETIALSGQFENIGEIPVVSRLVVEIYSSDETLVDTLMGESVTVGVGETVTLRGVTRLDQPGVYKFIAYVEYGNKVSGTNSINITVLRAYSPFVLAMSGLGALLFVILAVFLLALLKRRKKKLEPPVVNAPIYAKSTAITGTSITADGSLVEVFIDNKPLGTAFVQNKQWALAVTADKLYAGAQVKATARIDSNNDNRAELSDKSSKMSAGVVVQSPPLQPAEQQPAMQVPIAPVAPETPPVPLAPKPPQSKPSQPQPKQTQRPQADSSRLTQENSDDDLWTISL